MGRDPLPPSRLFAFGLARVAGGAYDDMEQLVLKGVAAELHRLDAASRRLAGVQDRLCDRLYAAVDGCGSPETRRVLLAAKRDVFNSRSIRRAGRLAGHLDADSETLAAEYRDLVAEVSAAREAALAAYARELPAARARLLDLGGSPTLQKGLALGSHALRTAYEQATRPGARLSERKRTKLERGLVKYLSRIHTKTSPFSTFTAVIPVEMVPGELGHGSVWLDDQLPPLHSEVQLNTVICYNILAFLTGDQQTSRRLPLRPNPTARRTGEHLTFLVNYNNIESFQRVRATPVVETLLNMVAAHPGQLCVADVVEEMSAQNRIDASADQVEAFMYQLVDCGLLEFVVEVSEYQEDWRERTCDLIATLAADAPHVKPLGAALERAPALVDRFTAAGPRERIEVLTELQRLFSDAFGRCQEEGKARPMAVRTVPDGAASDTTSRVFYPYGHAGFTLSGQRTVFENLSGSAALRLPEREAERLAASLSDLLQEMRPYDINVEERVNMRDYFALRYPQKSGPVPLLTFYEDYYQDRVIPELERSRHGEAPKRSEEIEARRDQGLARWKQVVAELTAQPSFREHGEMRLSAESLRRTGRDHPHTDLAQAKETSYAAFLQPYREDPAGGVMAVVNMAAPGFGKLFGRFLSALPPQIEAELRAANGAMLEDAMLLENSDASFFSANVHPPLLPYCVSIPGSRDGFPAEARVSVADLAVELPEPEGVLQLVHMPTRSRVFIIDLGLQVHAGRSKLFRLLDKFTIAQYASSASLLTAVNTLAGPRTEPVWRRPRIVYEGTLVLQRKAWVVAREVVPTRDSGETDAHYLVRLNEWRTAQGIPTECFVLTVNREQMTADEYAELAQERGDDRKPQYISFHNPFLVHLLERLVARAETTVTFEEMLPAPHQLSPFGGRRFVTEVVIQTYPEPRAVNRPVVATRAAAEAPGS